MRPGAARRDDREYPKVFKGGATPRTGGAMHASHGWPWMATQGLREVGNAQRNAAAVECQRTSDSGH